MKSAKKKRTKNPQLKLLANDKSAYGGDLLKTRAGRSRGRPLATRETMHLVLRSSKAKGELSFLRAKNSRNVKRIFERFSKKYGVSILSLANVGNHLHLQIKLGNRHTYRPFIRAVTGAIAMAVTGRSRWSKASSSEKFWDYRPYTRVVQSFAALLNLKDSIFINQLEGQGYTRETARMLIEAQRLSSA